MTKEVRQGAALICAALICLLLSLATSGQGEIVLRATAVLFGIGGLALVTVGLLREQA